MSSKLKSWLPEDDRLLRKLAKADWSIHMAAKQMDRLEFDIETRAEILGVKLSDRTAGKDHVGSGAAKAAEAVAKSQLPQVPGTVLP